MTIAIQQQGPRVKGNDDVAVTSKYVDVVGFVYKSSSCWMDIETVGQSDV